MTLPATFVKRRATAKHEAKHKAKYELRSRPRNPVSIETLR
jgi:hypothetical protein